MKAFILSTLFSLVVTSVSGGNIKGKVVDEKDTPIEFANIVLLSLPDSVFVQGTVSDQNGAFTLETKGQGRLLRVSSIGYVTVCQSCGETETEIIRLNSDTQMLDEVVIKASLPKTQLKGDALVTNVQNSVLTNAGTAVDVLGKIPGMVKEGDELKVLGRGNPEFYINGRKVRDNTELDELASDNIQSIEVITNPGARYDASVKAVVRIRTTKPVGEGLGISNRTYARYNKKMSWLDQLNLTYRTGGLELFGMLYYWDNYYWRTNRTVQHTYLDKYWMQNSLSDQSIRQHQLSGNVGMSYELNSKHSIGFNYKVRRTPLTDMWADMQTDIYRDNAFYEKSLNTTDSDAQNTTHQLNAYYTGKFGNWDIDLNADGIWQKQNNDALNFENVTNEVGVEDGRNITTTSEVEYKLYAGKLTASHPLWGGAFMVGGEYGYMNRTTDYRNIEGVINNAYNEIEERNVALFAEYSRRFGTVNTQIGLRYENVIFDYTQDHVYMDEQSKNYNNLFPSLSVTVPVGKAQLMFGYKVDIQRPYYSQLSSNVSYGNRYTYESGNPFLKPNVDHTFSTKATYKWVLLQMGYQRVIDGIFNVSNTYSENEPTIALLTQENVDAYDKMFASFSLSPTVGIWSPVFTAAMEKQWLKVETPLGITNLNKPQFHINWDNSIKLPADFLLTAGVVWNSKGDAGNFRTLDDTWMVNASLYKSVLNDRLTFLLQANDIFNTYEENVTLYSGAIRTLEQFNDANMQSVSLTIRFRLNNAKSKYKGTGAGESQRSRM